MNAGLDLRFTFDGRRTRFVAERQDPPWRVIRGFASGEAGSLVHLHNVSGGVLAGDCLRLNISVAQNARAQVTSTGATRLYRHKEGYNESSQDTSIAVEAGGLLEYLPDALIPFAASRHRQTTRVLLDKGATFFGWETLAPGRQAMGEQFAYDSLRISTSISSSSGPHLLEEFHLRPALRPLSAIARLGDYTHSAAFYAFQPGRPAADWRQLEDTLSKASMEASQPGCMIWGASALASGGVLVRGISMSARYLPAMLAAYWSTARFFLTGEHATPPRKLK